MKYFIVSFFIILYSQVSAQVPTLYNRISNEVHLIKSKSLNEDRQIYIHVPKLDSSDINTALPTLYLLDGENHFHVFSAYIEYLRYWKIIPPTIVVGIINVNRVKDLTPINSQVDFDGQPTKRFQTSGGNEQFFDFIQKDLMPFMEANYKTSPFKILAGHSFGGNTTINCMLTRPNLFSAYVAVSPSLWFGNKFVLQLAEKNLMNSSMTNKKIFYSVGNEGGFFKNDLLKFDKLIKQARLKNFEHLYKYYPDESHMTEPIPAYYDAIRFVYKDWAETKIKE